ncbi:MAG: hypothetical protein ACWA5P_10940 [bacterium]
MSRKQIEIIRLYIIGFCCILWFFFLKNSPAVQEYALSTSPSDGGFLNFFSVGMFSYGLLVFGIGVYVMLTFSLLRSYFLNKKTTSLKTKDDEFSHANKVYLDANFGKDADTSQQFLNAKSSFSVFIYNETNNVIKANGAIRIKSKRSHVFKITDKQGVALDNGIQFFLNNTHGLEVIDDKAQVSGLGDDWRTKLKVPEHIDWAFIITNPGKGDQVK